MSVKVIGVRLTKERKKMKKTQEDVSKETGIPRSTYSNYESGKREPDFETTKMLAKYFNINVNYLIGETDDPTPIAAPVYDEKVESNAAIIKEIAAKYDIDLSDHKNKEALDNFVKTIATLRQSDDS